MPVSRARRPGARALTGFAVLTAVALLTGCGADGPVDRAPVCSSARAAALDCGLSVATAASESGRAAAWLPGSPITLWFEPLNGRRTAILDDPLNTADVPIVAEDGLLWTGGEGSGSNVGCSGTCPADGFVNRITAAPARYRVQDGAVLITAGGDRIRFAPTRVPPPGSGPDRCSLAARELPCARLASITGTEAGAVVDALRTSPVVLTQHGTGSERTVTVRGGGGSFEVRLHVRSSGSTSTGPGGGGSFVRRFFSGTVSWQESGITTLLTSGDRTLVLVPVTAALADALGGR